MHTNCSIDEPNRKGSLSVAFCLVLVSLLKSILQTLANLLRCTIPVLKVLVSESFFIFILGTEILKFLANSQKCVKILKVWCKKTAVLSKSFTVYCSFDLSL